MFPFWVVLHPKWEISKCSFYLSALSLSFSPSYRHVPMWTCTHANNYILSLQFYTLDDQFGCFFGILFFSLVAKCSMFLILLSISFNFKRLMKVFLSLCNFYPGQFLFLTIVTWIWSHRFSIQIYVRVPFQKELASNGLQICLGWYTCNQCHNQCKKGCRFIFCRWSWGCACIIH